METVDSYGMSAYSCAADGTGLEAVPDAPGVLRCPTCGHRTDAPGRGTLADGFDVIHRQWGLLGDPHVWEALRDALAEEVTPGSPDAARVVVVDGLRRVADIDVDSDGPAPVPREQFAHGGMSSGMVDVGWWHDKGVPLIVERAVARRPTSTPPKSSLVTSILVWLVLGGIVAGTLVAGSWLLYQRAVGTPVQATVLACETSGNWSRYAPTVREDCVAEWTLDGATVVGGFNAGSGSPDVGKTVDATVRGDTAYSRSLVLPVVLIALGLPFLLILVAPLVRRMRGREPAAAR